MHTALSQIPERILSVAIDALTQANQHAVYHNPNLDFRSQLSVINAALAGELFLKAIIAKEHPLLIFRDLANLDEPGMAEIDLQRVIEKGRTYNFEHLPKLLWVATGERIPDQNSFEALRVARNSIQHFCTPDLLDCRKLSLEFVYKNLDPLIHKHFGLFAIEYHEDDNIGYDYVVEQLMHRELLFSVPGDFRIGEFDFEKELAATSSSYRAELNSRIADATLSQN